MVGSGVESDHAFFRESDPNLVPDHLDPDPLLLLEPEDMKKKKTFGMVLSVCKLYFNVSNNQAVIA